MWAHEFRIKTLSAYRELCCNRLKSQEAYLIYLGFERSFNKLGIDRKATKRVRIFSSAFLSQSLNGFKSTFYNTRSFAAQLRTETRASVFYWTLFLVL
jgi:hypothetical protein